MNELPNATHPAAIGEDLEEDAHAGAIGYQQAPRDLLLSPDGQNHLQMMGM